MQVSRPQMAMYWDWHACMAMHAGAMDVDLLGKHESGVNDDVAVMHSDKHAVHANLAKATNGQDAQGGALVGRRPGEWTVGDAAQS